MGLFADIQDPLLPQPGDPIILNRPRALRALQRKVTGDYSPSEIRSGMLGYPQLEQMGVEPWTLSALSELDTRMVERGQLPMSGRQSAIAAEAAPSPEFPLGRAVSPVPERTRLIDIPGNAVGDLRELFSSIPKLPVIAFQQLKELPQTPRLLSEAISEGDWQKATRLPGINLIPGAYTLGNLLEGDTKEIIENPLFTALDVLPYGKARVFDAASVGMLDEAGRIVRRPNLYRAVFPSTRAIGEAEAKALIGQNVFGQTGKVSAGEVLAQTKVGQAVGRQMDFAKLRLRGGKIGTELLAGLGGESRNLMIQATQQQRIVMDLMNNPNSPLWNSPEFIAKYADFAVDRPFLNKYYEFTSKWGDEFGAEKYGSVERWKQRRMEIGDMLQHRPDSDYLKKRNYQPLDDIEQQFVDDYKATRDALTEPYISRDLNTKRPFLEIDITSPMGKIESQIYPWDVGEKILKAREVVAAHDEFNFLRRVATDREFRSTLSAEDILSRAYNSPVLQNPRFTFATRTDLIEGYTHALMSIGVDARDFLANVKRAQYGIRADMPIFEAAQSWEKRLPVDPPFTIDDLDRMVNPRTPYVRAGQPFERRTMRPDSPLAPLYEAIRGGKVKRIKEQFRSVWDRIDRGRIDPESLPEAFTGANRDHILLSLDILQRRSRWMRRSNVKELASERVFSKANERLAFLEKSSVPAKYVPSVGDALQDRMNQMARELTDEFMADAPEAADNLRRMVEHGQFEALDPLLAAKGMPSGEAMFRRFRREARDSWRDLIDHDFQPEFVHHVSPGKSGRVHFPGVNLSARKPGSWHERTLDFAPSENDIALALRSDAMEHLLKRGEDHLIDTIVKGSPSEGWLPLARTRGDILASMNPLIERRLSRHPGATDARAIAEEMLNRSWVKFDASQYRNFSTSVNPETGAVEHAYTKGATLRPGTPMGLGKAEDLYIPWSVHRALEQMQQAPKAKAVLDPVMGLFRTTTLILSPRWQIYNLLGNALLGFSDGGWRWVRELPEAWREVRAVRQGAVSKMPLAPRLSMAQAGQDVMELGHLSREGLGQTASVLDSIKPGFTEKYISSWGKPLARGFNRAEDFLVRANALVDDVARVAGYRAALDVAERNFTRNPKLAGVVSEYMDEALKKAGQYRGSPVDYLRNQAEWSMRNWAYNWDQMTPWERSTARFIFPFYGFFSHILRYAGRYAADHPFRVAMTASFARAELEDWGTGLPQRIHNLLLTGKADEEGDQVALNFGGWNPFVDTANLFSLNGWLSQVNPFISTIFEQFGVDPRTGEAGVYPATEYDPVTGRLSLQKPSPVMSMLKNTVPQTQALSMLTGADQDMQRLRAQNPEAAGRLLLTSLGIPVLYRDVNVTQEVAQAEMVRDNAARQALSNALRAGSTAPVRSYPSLVAQVEKLQQAQAENPEAFVPYTSTLKPAGVLDMLQRVVLPWRPSESPNVYAAQQAVVSSTPGWG